MDGAGVAEAPGPRARGDEGPVQARGRGELARVQGVEGAEARWRGDGRGGGGSGEVGGRGVGLAGSAGEKAVEEKLVVLSHGSWRWRREAEAEIELTPVAGRVRSVGRNNCSWSERVKREVFPFYI